jgi:DNA repair exonuclease SbcCD ATPase subunit
LPDLSRPAISQLAGPARDVRMQQTRLKQAKERVESEKKEIERLQSEISGFLETRDSEDLQASIQQASERIASIRKFQQVDERLQKLGVHREELEGETIDLESDDGFSWERVIMLAIPFFIGAFMLISGLNNFFGWYNNANMPATARALQLQSTDTQNTGVLMTVLGMIILVATYLWWKSMEKGMEGELTDAETQLDTLVSQIRKTEHEKQELVGSLPEPNASVEQQLRQAEHELSECESYLPIYHNQAAAKARYNSARKQASDAAQGLKSARIAWKKTLHQLGLAESLSPKSLRILAEGYESLLITRKKLTTQSDELSQRRIELTSSLQKLDALHTQMQVALASPVDQPQAIRKETPVSKDAVRDTLNFKPSDLSVEVPQQRLQQMINALAQHKQYLAQRKDLRLQDEELSKKQKGFRRSVEKLISSRQSYLAEIGVESIEQLEALLSRKQQHEQLESQIAGLDQRIRTTLGSHVSYDAIERMLQNTPAHELEKRWETLTTRVAGAEERIGQLQLRQGEINQEMKTLAGDRRLAEAKLELASLERQVELCADHWRTLGFTTCMLEKVCEIYESERQPETLREASAFLKQLTEGKYVRVWTPLGKNALRIDNDKGQSLPLEVLSRGTREAVFIALRLSLAAAYSRRGATLPLVLDDVLVNFDTIRATSAAKVLRDFAALGHQVVMFTCHEHIMRMFDSIGVQVRVLPMQGQPGAAEIYRPDAGVAQITEKISEKITEKIIEPPALVIDVPVVTAQEPDPIVLPARTRVLAPKLEPEVAPAIKLVNEATNTESVPLWFEHEWIDSDDLSNPAPVANEFALADSAENTDRIWTQSENLPLPMPTDNAGLDGWWEDYAAQI